MEIALKTFGLLGRGLSHSFSPSYFNKKFHELNLPYSYVLFDRESISDLRSWAHTQKNLSGLNVTIPYKTTIIPFLDFLDSEAQKVGAVNTIAFRPEGLVGFNTDVIGFRQSLNGFLPHNFFGEAIVLGNGGAAKAVLHVLNQEKRIEKCWTVTRSPVHEGQMTWPELSNHSFAPQNLIVNTTPLGMFPQTDSIPDFPFQKLSKKDLLVDLVYNPNETLFLKKGKEAGCLTQGGLSMLYAQAEAAWEIWHKT